MEVLFSCSIWYRVEHSKRNSISPRPCIILYLLGKKRNPKNDIWLKEKKGGGTKKTSLKEKKIIDKEKCW